VTLAGDSTTRMPECNGNPGKVVSMPVAIGKGGSNVDG